MHAQIQLAFTNHIIYSMHIDFKYAAREFLQMYQTELDRANTRIYNQT